MTRSLLVPAAAAAALLLPGQALAALPAPKPPTSAGLAAVGVKVSWPLKAATTPATPGQRIVVRGHRGSARATVRLVRVTSSGKPIRTVAARTLRAGRFTATIPAQAPATYALRLTARGRTFSSWLVVPPPPSPPAQAPAPVPAPVRAPGPPIVVDYLGNGVSLPCGTPHGTSPAATATFVSTPVEPVAPATQAAVAFANTGDVCLINALPRLERQVDAETWALVTQLDAEGRPVSWPAVILGLLPATSWTTTASIPPDAVDGTYRVTFPVQPFVRSMPWEPVGIVSTPTFTVDAP